MNEKNKQKHTKTLGKALYYISFFGPFKAWSKKRTSPKFAARIDSGDFAHELSPRTCQLLGERGAVEASFVAEFLGFC